MDRSSTGSQSTSAETAASMEQITPRDLLRVAAVSLFILLLATLSTTDARVPFDLQVTNDTATLHIDGQVLHATWPKGIAHVAATGQDPVTRLFQVDGTDISGTDSYNPDTF